jgi:hypothetical protein
MYLPSYAGDKWRKWGEGVYKLHADLCSALRGCSVKHQALRRNTDVSLRDEVYKWQPQIWLQHIRVTVAILVLLDYIYRVRINYRSILQNVMTDASSVTKLTIPPSDRRLRRTTMSKLQSERALNRHKFQDTPTTLGRWGSHFPPTLVYDFPARWQ